MTELPARLEALLLVGGETASLAALARALEVEEEEVAHTLDALNAWYVEHGHGLRVLRFDGHARLATAPEHAGVVARFLGVDAPARLTPAALETLAIIAYRQPVTRPEVERIRGVSCDRVLRSLLDDGLIEERGRVDSPGRPTVYGTTSGFLQALGLRSLDELPPLGQ